MADDPRVFVLSGPRNPGQEIPLDYARTRREIPDRAAAAEIAPGVRVALLGTGDFLLPSGANAWGAQIAVWADPAPAEARFPMDEPAEAAGYEASALARRAAEEGW